MRNGRLACGARCHKARSRTCRCICDGLFHGVGSGLQAQLALARYVGAGDPQVFYAQVAQAQGRARAAGIGTPSLLWALFSRRKEEGRDATVTDVGGAAGRGGDADGDGAGVGGAAADGDVSGGH